MTTARFMFNKANNTEDRCDNNKEKVPYALLHTQQTL